MESLLSVSETPRQARRNKDALNIDGDSRRSRSLTKPGGLFDSG
jgi:hypothetical protein